jgi:hypothetical protein
MKKGKKPVPSFWISPQENLVEGPVMKLISKLAHRRCNSGIINSHRNSIVKIPSVGKISTRQLSPKFFKKSLNSKQNISKKLKVEKKGKKNFNNKKKKNFAVKLTGLKGNVKIKAPKIYSNQIFRDVYDEKGNHDRVMETLDVSLSLPEIVNEDEISCQSTPVNIEVGLEKYYPARMPKNPGSSFLQETKSSHAIDHLDLFQKLSLLE